MEWNTNTCYNMYEPSQLYALWKKLGRKDFVLYDFIYMNKQNHRCKEISSFQWLDVGESKE